ncbi:hypothetical protein AJ79_02994 [Helicocarpus griseus UAMH5409]|uniref:OefB n=1 Tax=Helicocarpus griseus UAMH5409 TaxID=1447875 RepID=A0A2B7Y0E5_9EURO|nr:hypothetical protein AJ79_02994 [Helicocarpus griseus UAMH5409]
MAEVISSTPQYHRNNIFYEHRYKPQSNSSKMWSGFSFSNSTLSSPSPSPSSIPPPPPPSPNDSLLDIAPRKTSFSTTSGRNTSCAFPSWPNRSSLFSDSDSSASAYLSDEDLFPTSSSSSGSESALEEEAVSYHPVFGAGELTTEEQINMINDAAEEEERRQRYLANAHAQLRAQQALRAAQILAAEQSGGKRRKRRVVTDKKRRAASTSSSSSKSSSG